MTPLFQVSPTEKADVLFDFSCLLDEDHYIFDFEITDIPRKNRPDNIERYRRLADFSTDFAFRFLKKSGSMLL